MSRVLSRARSWHHCVLGAILALGPGCGPGVEFPHELCRAVVCDDPPANECWAGGTLRRYAETGRCELASGTCSYNYSEESCSYGCHDAEPRCRRLGDVLWTSSRYPAFRDPDEDPERVAPLRGIGLSAARTEDVIYLSSPEGWLHAIEADGEELWRFDAFSDSALPTGAINGDALTAATVGDDDTIYLAVEANVLGGQHNLAVLQALQPDGTMRWAWSRPGTETSAPFDSGLSLSRDGQTIYFVDGRHLVAMSKQGAMRWAYDLLPRQANLVLSSELVVGPQDNVYLLARWNWGPAQGGVWAYLLTESGLPRWPPDSGDLSTFSATSAGADGTIYAAVVEYGVGSSLTAMREVDGRRSLQWRLSEDSEARKLANFSNAVVDEDGDIWVYADVVEDKVYGNDYLEGVEERIYVLTPEGEIDRRLPFAHYASVSLLLTADDTLIVVGSNPDPPLQVITSLSRDGQLRWERRLVEGTHPQQGGSGIVEPVVGPSGNIYAYSSVLGLVAVLGDKPLAKTPWPAPRADSQNTGRVAR